MNMAGMRARIAEHADFRKDRKYLRSMNRYMRKNGRPDGMDGGVRGKYVRAGYGYRKPRNRCAEIWNGTAMGILWLTLFAVVMVWLTCTQGGSEFAMKIGRAVAGARP